MPENTTEFDPEVGVPWRWWMPDSDRGYHLEIDAEGDLVRYQRPRQSVLGSHRSHSQTPAEYAWEQSIAHEVRVSLDTYARRAS